MKKLFVPIMTGFMVVLAVIFTYLFFSSRPSNETNTNLSEIVQNLKKEKKLLKKERKDYTTKSVLKSIEQNSEDIGMIKKDQQDRIKEALNLVYNSTKTEQEYESLKTDLPRLIGDSFSDELIKLDKPTLNETGKAMLTYGKMNEYKIAFGEYDLSKEEIPMTVIVNYQSPQLSGEKKDDKENVIKGQDIFNLKYDMKAQELELLDSTKGEVKEGNNAKE